MKVLMVNKFYYLVGGVERYMFEWSEMLERKGHQVIPFSMLHKLNKESVYNGYFVQNVDFSRLNGLIRKISVGLKTIYSTEARKNLNRLIKDIKPDIVHIHAFCYQLTPSILYSLREAKLPVIQTSHEYKLICPNQRLYNFYDNKICEECKGGRYYKTIFNKCIKNSLPASTIGCLEAYLYNILNIYTNTISLIVTPSNFMRNKMIELGIKHKKIIHIPNFININSYRPHYNFKNYFVYFGRLSKEKGIKTLIEAKSKIEKSKLVIVGEGELKHSLEKFVKNNHIDDIEFVGYKTGKKLRSIIKNAMFVVVPSEWYENSPYSILEAYALGKPVIGSKIGGIPELIDDGIDGLLFETKSSPDLAEKIRFLLSNPNKILEMGKNAREKIEVKYNSELHYERLMGIYQDLIKNNKQ